MSKLLIKHVNLASFVGVLGISSLIALPAFSQKLPANPANDRTNPSIQINTRRSGTTLRGTLLGGNDTYPNGSRINTNGIISAPTGERILPNVSVKHGDGSTSYYYQDGSHININGTTVPPTGTLIR